jgi:ABC-type phosphate transport system substrate-binding protein
MLEITAIGRDGLVFLVNSSNPVDSLTLEQLVGIYEGNINNWEDVGGESRLIKAFVRNRSSGSQVMMDKLVMNGRSMAQGPTELVVETMGGLLNAVAASYTNESSAIGYSVFYYFSQMFAGDDVKCLRVEGVEASLETISSGEYPLVNDFFVAIRSDEPEGSAARIVFDWLTGEKGRKCVIDAGYAPIDDR